MIFLSEVEFEEGQEQILEWLSQAEAIKGRSQSPQSLVDNSVVKSNPCILSDALLDRWFFLVGSEKPIDIIHGHFLGRRIVPFF